jgi:hypothetical protein
VTTSGGVPRDAPTLSHKEKLWRNRLAAWEDELRTDRYGMAHIAPRCIALLKSGIAEFWPGDAGGGEQK